MRRHLDGPHELEQEEVVVGEHFTIPLPLPQLNFAKCLSSLKGKLGNLTTS